MRVFDGVRRLKQAHEAKGQGDQRIVTWLHMASMDDVHSGLRSNKQASVMSACITTCAQVKFAREIRSQRNADTHRLTL